MDTLHDGVASRALGEVAGELTSYLDGLTRGILGTLTDADVLAELREFETLRRRLAVIDHALIAEAGRRALAGRLVVSSTSALLQAMLRLAPREADRRVAAAELCGPRWSLTGDELETLLPQVAAAQAGGTVSADQVSVIAATLERLPAAVGLTEVTLAERQLVRAAEQLPPRQLGIVGQRLLAQLDPDGVLAGDAEHARRRSFALIPQADGGYRAAGRLTPVCGALLLSWLSPR